MPDVLVPLSEIPEHQRGAYEIEAINDPDMFQKILSNENFFEMIAGFPDAWWSGGRLSMYLYRHENDDGLMIKNPVGEGNYIKPVIRQPVDRDWIANRNGGGKYQLWLNLSSPNPANPAKNISTTVKKYTFRIDGPPMVKEGQVIELGRKAGIGRRSRASASQRRRKRDRQGNRRQYSRQRILNGDRHEGQHYGNRDGARTVESRQRATRRQPDPGQTHGGNYRESLCRASRAACKSAQR